MQQLAALPAGDRRLLLHALSLVAGVRAALCVLPSRVSLRIVRRLADISSRAPRGRRASNRSPERIAWAIDVVSRIVPRATCLTQAASGTLLLRHHGYESLLCLGVARSGDGAFFAHAWVERGGRILIGGAQSAGFTRLPSLSSTFRHGPSVGVQ